MACAGRVVKLIALGVLAALAGPALAADCGADKLGTSRTIKLPRDGALYGTQQHAALPLEKGEVVLTFDDGPEPSGTPAVLAALADQCVKATFFMIGEKLAASPELARRGVAEGHSAGLHSNTHPHLSELGAQQQLDDLRKNQAAYQAALGVAAPAYRFPYLEETPTMLAALKAARVGVMSIDLGINDWLPNDTTEVLMVRLAENLTKTGRGIVLMHDANGPTVKALPSLLRLLKDKGYKVVHLEWEK
ncbi:Peptidoglycan/xylan/chitin deacetylase, PgdA/CDA1 family [Duganella sp. CF517]|uniref:polysaccharide deacetylase family protein n=1 Tax=Duganella sp. CF517 TaxID=1881038 RepID=UPI0008B8993E|nr:polysaccharide deacetylase family protein [Duganella sp. CF517]SEN17549.1 Peptidoglycan/xylan/chitin deacetylase, PgdA/CDA1 family [Duganella sp. CF517]